MNTTDRETPCSAFDAVAESGPFRLSERGDLWQRLVDGNEVVRWSYFGPIAEVTPTQLIERHRRHLAALMASHKQ